MRPNVQVCHWEGCINVGDTLTPVIFDWLGIPHSRVPATASGKFMGVGSILSYIKPGDVVWGAGLIQHQAVRLPEGARILAVRGKLSEQLIGGGPGVYGDPALLLPLIYAPTVAKRYKVGIIPHYAELEEKEITAARSGGAHFIWVGNPWRQVVNDILACETVVSSSLHGLVIAEAYGVPARWLKLTDKVCGNGFKFADYFTGTGRDPIETGTPDVLPPVEGLWALRLKLLEALFKYAAHHHD